MSKGGRSNATSDHALGLHHSITRRDFLNATLIGSGALLLDLPAPSHRPRQQDDWYGYGGVGDYAPSHGNTPEVVDVAHRVRDGAYDRLPATARDTGEIYDLAIVGGGFAGLGAAFEFRKARPDGRCLVLDNHPIFGGEAKRNEFVVNGQRLIGPQGSNVFRVPGPKEASYEEYTELGLPREFEWAPWASKFKPLSFYRDNYSFMLWIDRQPSNGYFFDDRSHGVAPGWVLDMWGKDLEGTPYPGSVKRDLRSWRASSGEYYQGDGIERWLDSMSCKDYLEKVMKLNPRVTQPRRRPGAATISSRSFPPRHTAVRSGPGSARWWAIASSEMPGSTTRACTYGGSTTGSRESRTESRMSPSNSGRGADSDVGAIVFDVTGLPDTTTIREVGRVRAPATPGGFHNIFAYKHSTGRAYLVTTTSGPHGNVYDLERFLADDPEHGLVTRIPNPSTSTDRGYHDFYVGYDPARRQDRLYGAGAGGYYVFDVTDITQPRLVTSITGAAGMARGHTFTPTPDGWYGVAETEYQYAPLRIFDMKPGLDGEVEAVSRPIGAWTMRWKGLPHNTEVRWPYVFVSAYEDGMQVFNMMDPTSPYTVGFYDTYDGPNEIDKSNPFEPKAPPGQGGVSNGSFGIDVRNADGLIVTADMYTGFWAFKMDGFDGWNGHQWGMPNISSVQDWDKGPDGAPPPARVS